jgi:hypothetical protein
MSRRVRGVLFADYVRMLRAHPGALREADLADEDRRLIEPMIDASGWYPLETFERLGLAILKTVAGGDLNRVREWGRSSMTHVAGAVDQLVVPGDPRESLMRFQVFRRTFFDFEALTVLQVWDGSAELQIGYGMGPAAEEAASVQTLGFFVGLIEAAGGLGVRGFFTDKAWEGAPQTVLNLAWEAQRMV